MTNFSATIFQQNRFIRAWKSMPKNVMPDKVHKLAFRMKLKYKRNGLKFLA